MARQKIFHNISLRYPSSSSPFVSFSPSKQSPSSRRDLLVPSNATKVISDSALGGSGCTAMRKMFTRGQSILMPLATELSQASIRFSPVLVPQETCCSRMLRGCIQLGVCAYENDSGTSSGTRRGRRYGSMAINRQPIGNGSGFTRISAFQAWATRKPPIPPIAASISIDDRDGRAPRCPRISRFGACVSNYARHERTPGILV